eukprot:TRINITY_DN2141_c0_g1_i1.p1 TRINITY_DN2141_c0_g1~~TRINITY_DN2141_c0_g1_i1.p1  ORF type:complete len:520 (-),score=22.45 TRINITY_DN2141_c0_g1_i1:416-1975(-)
MTEALLTSLSMENNHHAAPSTLLSMDSGVAAHNEDGEQNNNKPPDINLPLSVAEISSPPPSIWHAGGNYDSLDVVLAPHMTSSHETEGLLLNIASKPGSGPSAAPNRKCARRGDSIWGAWFFFSYYFKPALTDKAKSKLGNCTSPSVTFDKSDLRLDHFMVQHDMENMYMWVFKERPENALGKMQLRSYMNGHSRLGEPQFPFSVDRGFVRSHRMQRKHYRGLSNPQCVHGIEVVRSPNLSQVTESDLKKWIELTGREMNFSIPLEAEAFTAWRNLPSTEFDLMERPLKPPSQNNTYIGTMNGNANTNSNSCNKRLLNGSVLNLGGDNNIDLSPSTNAKKRKDFSPLEEDCCLLQPYSDRIQEVEINHSSEPPPWVSDFSGVMRQACGPVTAAKTIYEDEKGYLIVVSLPFTDVQRIRVSWRNTVSHGIVKVHCISIARTPYIKRGERTFKLTDPSPEHCPPGEFVREIALATRIPEDAELEAYCTEDYTGLEIMVPKHSVLSEEREVRVFLRAPNELP